MTTAISHADGKSMRNNAVLDKWRCVFFCIPKVANSSIKAALLKAMGFEVSADVLHRHPALNVQRTRYIANNCKNYAMFTIVRNTWDRLVSCYEQKICTERVVTQGFTNQGFYRGMPFAEFIKQVCKYPYVNVHFFPQLDAISYHGQVLPNFIGHFDHLAEDWAEIKRQCELPLDDLPHYNQSERGHYKEYYTREIFTKVHQTYRPEIDYFEFKF